MRDEKYMNDALDLAIKRIEKLEAFIDEIVKGGQTYACKRYVDKATALKEEV